MDLMARVIPPRSLDALQGLARRDGMTLTRPNNPQIEWNYGFDVEQLQTASSSLGHQFNYQHDGLFNRGDYEANAANQYRNVYSPGEDHYTIRGTVAPGSSVTISRGGGPAEEVSVNPDGTFAKRYELSEAEAAAEDVQAFEHRVVGILPGAGEAGTDAKALTDKTIVLSPSEHVPTYGAHGALQSDWCWQYHWNCRGRLKGMTTLANAASKGVPNQRLSFFYDQQGRRILKKVETLDEDGEVQRTVSHRFVYDGFLPLAEFIDDSQTGESARFYTWGLDIQESFHESGGVGALLPCTPAKARPMCRFMMATAT